MSVARTLAVTRGATEKATLPRSTQAVVASDDLAAAAEQGDAKPEKRIRCISQRPTAAMSSSIFPKCAVPQRPQVLTTCRVASSRARGSRSRPHRRLSRRCAARLVTACQPIYTASRRARHCSLTLEAPQRRARRRRRCCRSRCARSPTPSDWPMARMLTPRSNRRGREPAAFGLG